MGGDLRKNSLLLSWLFLCHFCILIPVEAQQPRSPGYPRIERLDNQDPLFSQLTDDVAASRRAFARGDAPPPLVLYLYTIRRDEDLLTIAARTNLGVETIATLNGIPHPDYASEGTDILLPNIPGVFTATEARNDLERMTLAIRYPHLQEGQVVVADTPEPRRFVFFPDDTFHPVERAYFLGILFRFPLREGYVSSAFGMRTHPFTGDQHLHSGIDIAAPLGSEVVAARGGKVLEIGFDYDGLGRYIVLAHDGGYTTLYGHLSAVSVTLNQEVNSGSLLGTVGTTGLSTGPHLHFEVRSEGQLKDPMPLIYGNDG